LKQLDLAPALASGGFPFAKAAAATHPVMTLALEALPCPDSVIRRLDPRWKLAALLLTIVVVVALTTLPATALALGGALGLVVLSRIPVAWYLRRIAPLALFLAFFVAALPFLVRDATPLARVGPLTLSWSGLRLALLLSGKALTLLTLVLVILTTSPLDATLRAAHALRLPGLLVQMVLLTHRYLFVLAGELARLRVALRVRGYRNRATRHSYRTAGHVAGTLLVRSYERAERVGQAMRCRGFDGRFRSLTTFQTRWADVVAFILVAASAAGLLAWDTLARG
jgi:cobalt/nickel transport system permease protein